MRLAVIRPLILPAFRWWTRLLQSDAKRVSAARKIISTILFLPPFVLVYVLLRVRLVLLGPVETEGRTYFGAVLRCHLPDLIQMYVYLFGVWEPDLSHFIQCRLRRGDVFVDVGANVGYDSLLAATCVGAEGRIIAIDASPTNYRALLDNLSRNAGPDRIRTLNAAVTDVRGRVEVFGGPEHNVGLATTVSRQGLAPEATVDGAPLADLLTEDEARQTRLVKIDIEGAEPNALAGMVALLDQFSPDLEIMVELSPHWWENPALTPDEVIEPFLAAGFYPYSMANQYLPWRYLWPNAISRPKRIRGSLPPHVKRIDLVLSRIDADQL